VLQAGWFMKKMVAILSSDEIRLVPYTQRKRDSDATVQDIGDNYTSFIHGINVVIQSLQL